MLLSDVTIRHCQREGGCLYDVNMTYLAQYARSRAVVDKEKISPTAKSAECSLELNRFVGGLLANNRPAVTSSLKRYLHAINFNILTFIIMSLLADYS
jgi:hypothetical protein